MARSSQWMLRLPSSLLPSRPCWRTWAWTKRSVAVGSYRLMRQLYFAGRGGCPPAQCECCHPEEGDPVGHLSQGEMSQRSLRFKTQFWEFPQFVPCRVFLVVSALFCFGNKTEAYPRRYHITKVTELSGFSKVFKKAMQNQILRMTPHSPRTTRTRRREQMTFPLGTQIS